MTKVLEIKSCVECKNCIDRFCLLLDDYFPEEFEEKGGIYKDCLLPDAKDYDTKALESIKATNRDPNRVKQVKEFYEEGTQQKDSADCLKKRTPLCKHQALVCPENCKYINNR